MKETAMRVWLRLTHLFGLPEGDHSDNLMEAALGPVLRAACQDIVDAALPEPIARLVQELVQREQATQSQNRSRSRHLTYRLRPLGRPRRVRRVARADRPKHTIAQHPGKYALDERPAHKAPAIEVSSSYTELVRRA